MKNVKQKIILCAGIILAGLIAACSNPLTDESADSGAGTGNVLIRIAGGNERTILPSAANFSKYTLEVVDKTGTKLTVPANLSGLTGSGVSMTLTEGEYTVTVKAYRMFDRKERLAAQGSKTITVSSGLGAPVVIDLKPFMGTGETEIGFFSYHITLPSGVSSAMMNIKSVKSEGGQILLDENINLLESGSNSATPWELPAGYYELAITLVKDNVKVGEYAAVHIYSGLETAAVFDLSNDYSAINLEPLLKVIKEAQSVLARVEDNGDIKISNNAASVPVGLQWIPQTDVNKLQAALTTAQGVVNYPPTKQSGVRDAANTLQAALAAFTSALKPGGKLDTGTWTGLMTAVQTPVTFTVNNGNTWSFAVPLAGINITSGTSYTVSETDGTISFKSGANVYATGTPSTGGITLIFTNAILGANTVTLTKGTAAAPKPDIEFLYSGIWTNAAPQPVITYISSERWTFSFPSGGTKASGTLRVYDRKAAFYKTDGSFFAVAKVATDKAELAGNTLYIYTVTGGSFELNLNPYPNPFISNWQGGSTISGTLYVGITDWSLENGTTVTAKGEYVWKDDKAYFVNTNGTSYATGTINAAKNVLTLVTANNQTQAFTLIQSPFVGTWGATVMLVATVKAVVTNNTYDITSNMTDPVNGQYTWRTANGKTTGKFYSNGYDYGSANLDSSTQITVTMNEPLSAAGQTISTITVKKQ
jgi:hypothetical protein